MPHLHDQAQQHGRRGGRTARRTSRLSGAVRHLPPMHRTAPLHEVLSEERVEAIHRASLRILQEVGCDFRDAEALSIWRDLGAEIDGERVRIPEELLLGLIAQAPPAFTLHARDPERSVPIGGNASVFAPTYGSPFVRMFDLQRRYGTMADLEIFHKLACAAPALHVTGAVTCEPVDVPISKRHLHITRSALVNSDKPIMGPVTAPERAEDAVAMAKLVHGDAFVDDNCVMLSILNANTPLIWDETMLGALKVYARANQGTILSPFTMAGANTPASTPATIALLNAEALAGIAFAQAVRPGAPVVYGNFLAAVSMRSGAPMTGTSETFLMTAMIGQLARRYSLPWRSSGMITGAKTCDAQAGYESATNMMALLLSGCNFLMHSCGWSEAGLTANLAKFMIDAEQCEMLHRLGDGPRFDDFEEALATIADVGPGGHFLGTPHTQAHFQDAFFESRLADNNSYEQWLADGEKTMEQRGLEAAAKALEEFVPPPIAHGVVEALDEYIAKREAVLPDTLQ